MNHAISGEILAEEVRFPRSEIFFATLAQTVSILPGGQKLKKINVYYYLELKFGTQTKQGLLLGILKVSFFFILLFFICLKSMKITIKFRMMRKLPEILQQTEPLKSKCQCFVLQGQGSIKKGKYLVLRRSLRKTKL